VRWSSLLLLVLMLFLALIVLFNRGAAELAKKFSAPSAPLRLNQKMYTKKSALQNPHLLLFINYITTTLQPPPQILRLFPKPGAVSREPSKPNFMFKRMSLFALIFTMVFAIPAAAQVPAYVPTDGLVGWWPFNGNANDESGNGNDGVVNGATLTSDRDGVENAAYNFDGLDDFIAVNSLNSSQYAPVTYSLWFWANQLVTVDLPLGNQVSLIGRDLAGTFNQGDVGFWHHPSQSITQKLHYYTGASGQLFDFSPSLGRWYHLSLVYSSNYIITAYIDGQLIESYSFDGSGLTANIPFRFGAGTNFDGVSTRYNWNGYIDDIAIYNRALTEQEIQNLYTGTTPPPCVSLPSNLQQGLVGYWPFCGNANDESGNGNDGVVNGATLIEDRFGNAGAAYGFDGVDDGIDVSASPSLVFDNQQAISYWLNMAEFPTDGNEHHIISKCGPIGTGWEMIVSNYSNNNWIEYRFWGNPNPLENATEVHIPFAFLELNTYNHFVVNQDDDTLYFYLNGELIDQHEKQGTFDASNDVELTFGTRDSLADYAYPYQGIIDDIGIWNRALTPEEVQELYTLDACTFTVYDTLTVYETVYDTVYTYETIYDTVTTYITVTDTLLIDITFTGFEGQPSWLNTVTVFPNPASDHITIDYGNFALMAGYNTIITDAAGATVYSSAVNSQQVDIDINAWGATGVYYIMIYDSNGVMVAVRQIVLE
jgi:hypothetical protein